MMMEMVILRVRVRVAQGREGKEHSLSPLASSLRIDILARLSLDPELEFVLESRPQS